MALLALLQMASVARAGSIKISRDPGLQTLATEWDAKLAGYLGFDLAYPPPGGASLRVAAGWVTDPAKYTNGHTTVYNKVNGDFDEFGPVCQIAFNKAFFEALSADGQQEAMAHEVFHCYEHAIAPRIQLVSSSLNEANWIIEGLARWVDLTVRPGSAVPGSLLKDITRYADTSSSELFTRSYDAAGFWGHVQDVTGRLWERIPAILRAGVGFNDGAAFGAAVPAGDAQAILSTWGSSVLNLQQGGATWQEHSPLNATRTFDPSFPRAVPMTIDRTGGIALKPYSTAQLLVEPKAAEPLIHIEFDHTLYGVFDEHEQLTPDHVNSVTFCSSSPVDCSPPPISLGACRGPKPAPPQRTEPFPATPYIGVAAAGLGGAVTVTYSAPTQRYTGAPCKGNGGATGTAGSGGDPELFPFDGGEFDFQAAGEFTLLKSTRDDLDVQVRQQPFPDSRYVAENTAVAMRVGSDTVEVDALGKDVIALYVNKALVKVPSNGSLRMRLGSASLFDDGIAVDVRWPDGSTVDAIYGLADANDQGVETPSGVKPVPVLDLVITLTAGRRRRVEGLLGNWGTSAADEFVGSDGHRYPQSVIESGDVDSARASDLRVLYDEFGASWRITRRESLFRYPPGKSTGSYSIRGFPERYLTPASLSPSEQASGRAACLAAGVTNARVLRACELDVGATGYNVFAAGDGQLQKVAGLPASPTLRTPSTPSTLHPIDLAPLTSSVSAPALAYDPISKDTYVAWTEAGDASIAVCVVTATAPDCNGGTGPDHLTDAPASTEGGALYSDPQIVIEPSGEVVVLAEIDGADSGFSPPGYPAVAVVAWSSPAGGSAFTAPGEGLADGGALLAPGFGDAPSGGATALGASDIGVFGTSSPNGFSDFTLTMPAPATAPVLDTTNGYQATVDVTGEQLAALPDPGVSGQYIVVTVGAGSGSGCPAGSDATGYGVADGTPTALEAQSAWSPRYFTLISCEATAPVLAAGGPAGGTLGLLENEGPELASAGTGSVGVYYRRFDTGNDQFGPPVLVSDETTQTLLGASDLDVSQDAAGDVYATWQDNRGTVLDYSTTAGASWPAPLSVPLPLAPEYDLVLAGVGGGSVELAYSATNAAGADAMYLLPVSYAELGSAER